MTTTALRAPQSAGISHPWPEPPSMGGLIAVAPGIRWLRMPLPFRLDHINLYLLEDGDGVTVVDAGIGVERTRELWQGVLEAELGGKPITRVFVTHFHPDHMGNAHWLTQRCGVDLWCSQAEWLMAQLAWRAGDIDERLNYYRRNGVTGPQLESLRERRHHYARVAPSVAPAFHGVRDGDVIAIGERQWEVLTVFGHSPEQAILYSREARVLISGDQVLPKITTNVSVWAEQPWENPLKLYLDSLERFRPIGAGTLVLPSHGLPFGGLHDRIAMLRDHHAARLSETLDALREPRSAAEVVPVLFRRQLDTHQLGFAMGEALAHLHFLEADGRAARVVSGDGIHRFVKA
jgi:glyoxylase-like metal-dependent hydrolase (beta-lactamase superfamily II)